MPSPTTTDLPIPKSWDEFEDICADLLKCMWRDPYVVRNGRSGQRQHGVDIYGKPVHLKGRDSETAGAQCKRVEALTEKDIKNEIEQATEFKPSLEEYLLLTTLKRDAACKSTYELKTGISIASKSCFGKIYHFSSLNPMNFSRNIFRYGSKQGPQ